MMLREIFSMISPFRGHSRAKRSAAFGGADDAEEQEQQQQQQAIDSNSNTMLSWKTSKRLLVQTIE